MRMGAFGRSPQAMAPFQAAPIEGVQVADTRGLSAAPPQIRSPRRGMFGRAFEAFSKVTPEQWRMIGATAHDLSRGTNMAPDLAAQLNMERRQRAMDDRQAAQDAWEIKQRADMDAWVNSLPQQYRALARIAPDAVAKMMMSDGSGYDWKDGGAFDPRTGAWTPNEAYWREQRRLRSVGSGNNDLPPLPPGFEVVTGR